MADKHITREYIKMIEGDRGIFAVQLELIKNLNGEHHGGKRKDGIKSPTIFDFANFYGFGAGHKEMFSDDKILHKLLYNILGANDRLMYRGSNGKYILQYDGLLRLNRIFDEVESHYLRYHPKAYKVLCRYLISFNQIENNIVDKEYIVKGVQHKCKGLELSDKPSSALKQMTEVIKVLGLLQHTKEFDINDHYDKTLYPKQLTTDLFGNYLKLWMIRSQLDLSLVYQKRQTLFHTIVTNILKHPNIHTEAPIIVETVASNTDYEDYIYQISVPYTLTIGDKTIKCMLHGRTKGAKSIIDKLRTNERYGYIEAMNDLFALSHTVVEEENLPELLYFQDQIHQQKKINQIKSNIDKIKAGQKGRLFDYIKEIGDYNWDSSLIGSKIPTHQHEKFNYRTGEGYRDCKYESDFIVDGHLLGVEIKIMSEADYQKAINDPNISHNGYKLRGKFPKEGRSQKILSPQDVLNFVNKIKKKGEYAGSRISISHIPDYIKKSLYTVKFTYNNEVYYGYMARDNQKHIHKHNLAGDYEIIERIDPDHLVS